MIDAPVGRLESWVAAGAPLIGGDGGHGWQVRYRRCMTCCLVGPVTDGSVESGKTDKAGFFVAR